MKKLLLFGMLFVMLTVITPAYAADADGLWYGSSPDGSTMLGMTRENSGYLLYTFLDCYEWRLADWFPLFGPFNGTTGNLSLILTSEANGNIPQAVTVIFTMTSSSTATLKVASCTNFATQDNCPPDGTVLNLTKIF
jgi:hypothetical protein